MTSSPTDPFPSKLISRISKRFHLTDDEKNRFTFLQFQKSDYYYSLIKQADVVLDPFGSLGGGITSLEILYFHVPIVTFPRGMNVISITSSLYRALNISDSEVSIKDLIEILFPIFVSLQCSLTLGGSCSKCWSLH